MKELLFIDKSVSDFKIFFWNKRINDVLLHDIEFISIFFNIKRTFAIWKYVFVNMLNAKKFENFKMCYIENVYKRFVAIINNNFCIF